MIVLNTISYAKVFKVEIAEVFYASKNFPHERTSKYMRIISPVR